MAFERPPLRELIERSAADIEAWIPGGDAHVRRHKLHLLGRVNAGAAHSQHGHMAYLALQILPDTADWETLLKWGSLRGLTPLKAAGAYGTINVTGQPNALLKSGDVFQRSDGWEYVVSQTINLDASGKATAQVVSLVGGYTGNSTAGSTLRLTRAIAGIASSATVVSIAGGADAEGIESFRERVIFRWRNPPQAGALHDYIAWAREAHPAVTRAWAYRNEMGPNTVTVRFVCDHDPNGLIPTQQTINEVYQYIRAVMPATPELYVVAPIPVAINTRLTVSPDTAQVRGAVELEIADFYLTDPDIQPGGSVFRSRLSEAISKASGERFHSLTLPAADLMFGVGEIPTHGQVIWPN
jgi:uncharacterized phage protein gp47/JayE